MKTEIGSYEAKTKLPELLRKVKNGKSYTITNRGKAIADLVPTQEVQSIDLASAVENMKAFMRSRAIKNVNIKQLIESGRD